MIVASSASEAVVSLVIQTSEEGGGRGRAPELRVGAARGLWFIKTQDMGTFELEGKTALTEMRAVAPRARALHGRTASSMPPLRARTGTQ